MQLWTLRLKSNLLCSPNDVHLLYDRCPSTQNINSAYETIISGLFQLSNERKYEVICCNSSNRKNVPVREPWFDNDCYQAEKSAIEILSAFREEKCALNAFNNARKNYYDLCKLKRNIYVNNNRSQLCRDAETGYPRFWENLSSQAISR